MNIRMQDYKIGDTLTLPSDEKVILTEIISESYHMTYRVTVLDPGPNLSVIVDENGIIVGWPPYYWVPPCEGGHLLRYAKIGALFGLRDGHKALLFEHCPEELNAFFLTKLDGTKTTIKVSERGYVNIDGTAHKNDVIKGVYAPNCIPIPDGLQPFDVGTEFALRCGRIATLVEIHKSGVFRYEMELKGPHNVRLMYTRMGRYMLTARPHPLDVIDRMSDSYSAQEKQTQ